MPKRSQFVLTYRNPNSLKDFPGAAVRNYSSKHIEKLALNMSINGCIVPPLVDADDQIVCGHARRLAAIEAGLKEIPVFVVSHMSELQLRQFRLFDNKITEDMEYNQTALAKEFRALLEINCDEIHLTGYETVEIDQICAVIGGDEDLLPLASSERSPVTRLGDLLLLGQHRLYCGNALEEASYEALLAGRKAQMVITDPPYNVKVKGHVGGNGKIKHDEFLMASGEMLRPEFTDFLGSTMSLVKAYSVDGSIHYFFMDWRHIPELLAAADPVFGPPKQLCVWDKGTGRMGTFYRSQHELILIFKNGTETHINNFGLGAKGRYRTNVWSYPGVNTLRNGPEDELALHPTVKPVAMIADAILDCSKRGGIILDPFMGSGTTIIAAEKTGRTACGMELDPRYIDVAVQRWQAYTGQKAVFAATGEAFDDVCCARGGRS